MNPDDTMKKSVSKPGDDAEADLEKQVDAIPTDPVSLHVEDQASFPEEADPVIVTGEQAVASDTTDDSDLTDTVGEVGTRESETSETPGESGGGVTGREKGEPLELEGDRQKAILEALLYVSDQPLSLDRMAGILRGCTRKELRTLLDELNEEYVSRGRAFEIVEVAQGYQVRTRSEFGKWISKLKQQKPQRLSRPALESLAIIAYRQPVTRAEIESIRGVDTGAVLGSLLEKRMVRILGRKEVPGRPILYGTTQDFLELFGLKNLSNLPTLREIESMFEKEKDHEDDAAKQAEGEEIKQEIRAGEQEDSLADSSSASEKLSGQGQPTSEDEDEDLNRESTDTSIQEEEAGGDEEEIDEELETVELDAILRSTKTKIVSFEEDVKDQDATGEQETIGEQENEAGGGGSEKEQETGKDREEGEKDPPAEGR